MFKKGTIWGKIRYSVFAVVLSVALLAAFGLFFAPTTASAERIEGRLNLVTPTDISGATINFATADESNNANYTGNPIQIVKSITVGTDEVYNLADDQTTNFVVSYRRNGVASTDITSVGEIEVTVTGQNNYSGEVSTTFTINKAKIKVEFQDELEYKIDDTAMDSLRNGSGMAVFFKTLDNVMVDTPQGLVVTYFNKTLGIVTNGFTNSGEYLVNVVVDNDSYTLVGLTSTEVYVKALVLQNQDGTIRVENANGFEKGVSLGEASVITNKNAINARTDLENKDNISALINITFLKNGVPFILEDEVVIKIKAGDLDYEKMVLKTNDYSNSKFEKVDYTQEDGTVSLKVKSSAKDAEGNDKVVATNSYVLTTESEFPIAAIIAFSLTGLAIVILVVLKLVLYASAARKRK